jgi:hypothetical protein
MPDALQAAIDDFARYARANDFVVREEVDTVVKDVLSAYTIIHIVNTLMNIHDRNRE